uniref:Uncharacterized protein n=1 Tax=Hyaloperonospora arabidopsidis (strain Emoy2) TaxID=559515 RepID=M4B9K0_HYAAE
MSKVSGPERDKKGSQAWQTAAPSVIVLRPTNATFAKDKIALSEPNRDSRDKRVPPSRACLNYVSAEVFCLPMWIPARELSATFYDT